MTSSRRVFLRHALYTSAFVGASAVAPGVLKTTQAAPLTVTQFADNTLIKEPSQPRVYVVIGGAALYVPDPAQLDLYGGSAAIRIVPTGTLSTLTRIPQDNTLIQEYGQRRVYVVIGGAALYVPAPEQFDLYGGGAAIRIVPTGTLSTLAHIPQDNTLIREYGQTRVYVIENRTKQYIPSPAGLVPYGGTSAIRDVPSGTLANIPDTPPPLPPSPPTRTPVPPPPPPTEVPLPNQLGPFDTGYITFDNGVPVGGYSQVTLYRDGSYNFTGHFHVSGAPSYDTSIVLGIKSASGVLFTFAKTGRVHGTFEPGSRDFDWGDSGTNPAVAANWADLARGTAWRWGAAATMDILPIIDDIKNAIGVVTAVVAVVG